MKNNDDECVWYLINNLLDTCVGVLVMWICVRLIEIIARRNNIASLVFGCYYNKDTITFDDFNLSYYIWAVQAFTWLLICFFMKVVIYYILITWTEKLENFGKFLLENIAVYPKLELFVVMIVVPFIMNCIQVIFL